MEPTVSYKSWKGTIFKKGDKKTSTAAKKQEEKYKDKGKRRERERVKMKRVQLIFISTCGHGRIRSAGNSVTRPKLLPGAPGTRKHSRLINRGQASRDGEQESLPPLAEHTKKLHESKEGSSYYCRPENSSSNLYPRLPATNNYNLSLYMLWQNTPKSTLNRRKALASIAEQEIQGSIMHPQKPQVDTC
ncbi:hypothetical protein SADUNF_Sadunf11G0007500 [Salix dunnii]|uniref:Uncharacterized protein n=1 Tax=Salix dunnii TaxID=1413687 RepID=A0A835JKU9_9ROSI|nr:hypothetical protein SADUNF_Sadunf11G0007500 [Salix dunnii]